MKEMTPEESVFINALTSRFIGIWLESKAGQNLVVAAAQRFIMFVFLHYAAHDMDMVGKNAKMFVESWEELGRAVERQQRPQDPRDN